MRIPLRGACRLDFGSDLGFRQWGEWDCGQAIGRRKELIDALSPEFCP
jgi:hypothetical protein